MCSYMEMFTSLAHEMNAVFSHLTTASLEMLMQFCSNRGIHRGGMEVPMAADAAGDSSLSELTVEN